MIPPKGHAVIPFYIPQGDDPVGKFVAWGTSVNRKTWKKTVGKFCHSERIFSDGQSFSSQENRQLF